MFRIIQKHNDILASGNQICYIVLTISKEGITMRNSKFLSVICLILAIVSIFCACSRKNAPQETASKTQPATAPAVTEMPVNGQVELTYEGGAKYIGNLVDGKRSGQGKMIFADGAEYE